MYSIILISDHPRRLFANLWWSFLHDILQLVICSRSISQCLDCNPIILPMIGLQMIALHQKVWILISRVEWQTLPECHIYKILVKNAIDKICPSCPFHCPRYWATRITISGILGIHKSWILVVKSKVEWVRQVGSSPNWTGIVLGPLLTKTAAPEWDLSHTTLYSHTVLRRGYNSDKLLSLAFREKVEVQGVKKDRCNQCN